uniref:Methyltransferase domain-containing protein n=1 Tax=Eiseniibacteriota bacterium TaxID=2212470 RepID=A0A832I899_UNCEI
MAIRPSRYVHGTAPREQRRLTRLNDLMNAACLRALAPRRGERAVDFGAGLGQMTRAIARATGVPVVAIEASAEQIAEARRQARAARESALADWRAGDVLDPPLARDEWGAFDLAHARFILEHVADPLAVVRRMVQAVRPGGRVVLADDDHDVLRLWPEPPGVAAVWRGYMRTYDRNGADPIVGRRLVELLHAAGARPVRNDWVFFGACAGHPHFEPLVANLAAILEGARAAIVGPGLADALGFDEALRALRAWGRRPDAALWFAISWAEGVRPGGGRRPSGRTARRAGRTATRAPAASRGAGAAAAAAPRVRRRPGAPPSAR